MIRAVTIDFWNTLFDSDGGAPRNAARRVALLSAIRDAGHACNDDRFDEVYRGIWEYFDEHWLNRQRTPTSREMIGEILRQLDFRIEEGAVRDVCEIFERGVLDHPPRMMPGVPEALESLASAGVKLAVISDTAFSPGVVLKQLMEVQGIARYFSRFVFSDETGVAKPHPDAFRLAIEPLQASPEESVHVGDIERTDIRGAKSAGMRAVLYKGEEQVKYAENETAADAVMEDWREFGSIIQRLR